MATLKSSGVSLLSNGLVLSSAVTVPDPPPPVDPPSPEAELVGTNGASNFGIHDMADAMAIG